MSFPRYPSYKDSGVEWLGMVPAHWDVVQFKQFVDIQNGSDHKHVEQADGYPVLGSGGAFTYASDFLYDGESVLLGRKGTIDKPLHITGRFWTVDTMYWTKISPDVSGRFAYYSALTIPFDFYSTNTALPSMTKGALSSHRVACPPLPEQTQIAAFLDRETAKIDELVAEQRRLMELLKEKRQAVISHAVTQGLNPDAPMKPSGIEWLGDVPAHWVITPLKWLTDPKRPIMYGIVLPGPDVGEGVPILKGGNVKPSRMNLSAMARTTPEIEAPYARARLKEGDLVYSIRGTIGDCEPVPAELERSNITQDVARIAIGSDFCARWARWALLASAIRDDLACGSLGATVRGINIFDLKRASIPTPPLSEQIEISEFITDETAKLDTLTAEAQHAIDLLQERRSALISAAVTGQIDVRPH
ncbi:MAG: restriction endonuclease subunit S [Sulfuritalea sp.]|nr:restriction endonuclease subunit S [Sulfuritalea sp.]